MNRTSFLNTQVISHANPVLRTCSRPGSSLEWSQCCNGQEALCWVSVLPDLLHLTPYSPTCTCAPCLLYGRITLLRNPKDHENTAGASQTVLFSTSARRWSGSLCLTHVQEVAAGRVQSLVQSVPSGHVTSALAQNHPQQVPSAGLFLLGTNNRETVL